MAANDNVPGISGCDDVPFVLALGLICIGVVALAAYVGLSGTEDVVAMLKR